MASSVRFVCQSLAGVNKVGNLKQDENGYWTVVIGALGAYNSAGHFYEYESAKALFESSSSLMRRVSRGSLRGEYGHPRPERGQSEAEFANRIMSIWETNTCCQFKEIWLDFESVKDEKGKPVIAIMAKVIPSGPHGPVLEKQLQNKDENVCFSIRAFTDDYMEGGIRHRVLKTVVTFDYVNEPGMSVANKYKSPALESLEEVTITRNTLNQSVKSVAGVAAMESVSISLEELFDSMNWKRENAPKRSAQPAWVGWATNEQ
jgi:hypothetical protein